MGIPVPFKVAEAYHELLHTVEVLRELNDDALKQRNECRKRRLEVSRPTWAEDKRKVRERKKARIEAAAAAMAQPIVPALMDVPGSQ